MPKIKYIQHDNTETVVEVEVGSTLMQGAIDNNISGIDADCGGDCSCGTCHVIVEASMFSILGQRSEIEESMLDLNADKETSSRLSCQVEVTCEMDGLVVHVPQYQM